MMPVILEPNQENLPTLMSPNGMAISPHGTTLGHMPKSPIMTTQRIESKLSISYMPSPPTQRVLKANQSKEKLKKNTLSRSPESTLDVLKQMALATKYSVK